MPRIGLTLSQQDSNLVTEARGMYAKVYGHRISKIGMVRLALSWAIKRMIEEKNEDKP